MPVAELLKDVLVSAAYLATRRLAIPIAIYGLLEAQDIVWNRPPALPFAMSASRVQHGAARSPKM
jgi:hypothetical protein